MRLRSLSFTRRALTAALCLLAVLPAHAIDGIVDNTVVFGMSAPLTGPTGAYGRQMKEGIEAYFQRVNTQGGVAGRRLRLVAHDDGYVGSPGTELEFAL